MLVKKSLNSVSLIAINRDALLSSLKEISVKLKCENPNIKEIRLFGSIAKGEQTGKSDVDILIIVSSSDTPIVLRSVKYRKYFDIEIPVDIIVYTENELNIMLKQGNKFIKEILKESIQL